MLISFIIVEIYFFYEISMKNISIVINSDLISSSLTFYIIVPGSSNQCPIFPYCFMSTTRWLYARYRVILESNSLGYKKRCFLYPREACVKCWYIC